MKKFVLVLAMIWGGLLAFAKPTVTKKGVLTQEDLKLWLEECQMSEDDFRASFEEGFYGNGGRKDIKFENYEFRIFNSVQGDVSTNPDTNFTAVWNRAKKLLKVTTINTGTELFDSVEYKPGKFVVISIVQQKMTNDCEWNRAGFDTFHGVIVVYLTK